MDAKQYFFSKKFSAKQDFCSILDANQNSLLFKHFGFEAWHLLKHFLSLFESVGVESRHVLKHRCFVQTFPYRSKTVQIFQNAKQELCAKFWMDIKTIVKHIGFLDIQMFLCFLKRIINTRNTRFGETRGEGVRPKKTFVKKQCVQAPEPQIML